ncbi:MAG: hypothetical protein FWG25_02475 [Promicromonosporaceae bacterium]|nr:hypothetical protein [Promicromonosporaceae bacterium]
MASALRRERNLASLRYCTVPISGLCPDEQLNDEWLTSEVRASILEREIALALADFDCAVATDHQGRRDAALIELQLVFIENYRGLLELYHETVLAELAAREN